MCECVCYHEGKLKQFNAPPARMLKTNQHVESFRPQFLHKEALLADTQARLKHDARSKKAQRVHTTTKNGRKERYQQARSDHQDLPRFLST